MRRAHGFRPRPRVRREADRGRSAVASPRDPADARRGPIPGPLVAHGPHRPGGEAGPVPAPADGRDGLLGGGGRLAARPVRGGLPQGRSGAPSRRGPAARLLPAHPDRDRALQRPRQGAHPAPHPARGPDARARRLRPSPTRTPSGAWTASWSRSSPSARTPPATSPRGTGRRSRSACTSDRTFDGCARSAAYEIAPDGMSLTVRYDGRVVQAPPRRGHRGRRARRGRRRRAVQPSILSTGDSGGTAVARLRAPLGDRPVYDASDGRRLLQSGPAPGAPPCPGPLPDATPLEQLAAERAPQGMSTDPALLESLLAADETYTPEEKAWRELVYAAEFENGIHDYLHGGRVSPDWGGTTLVARYPEPPYLLVRLHPPLRLPRARGPEAGQGPGALRALDGPARLVLHAAAVHRRRRPRERRVPRGLLRRADRRLRGHADRRRVR